MLPVEVTSTATTAQKLPTIFRDKSQNPANMTPRSYPCIINIIRDLVNSIEDRSGIDLSSPGFDPAEKFAIESFLIGVLDRYGKVKCNSGTSDQSNSNGVDLPSPNKPPSTPVSTPFKSSPKESRSTTIDLDTAQTSPASGANSTPAASRGSGAKSKRARAGASRSSSPSGSDGRQNMYPRNPYPVPAPLPPNSEGAAQSATNSSHTRMFRYDCPAISGAYAYPAPVCKSNNSPSVPVCVVLAIR